ADDLAERGFVATTASEGAGKWTADLNEYFRDKIVYILADNDDAGAKHALTVAERLHGIAREVRIVNLPDLSPKEDVSDWLDRRGDPAKLIEICRSAPLYTHLQANHTNNSS